MNRSDSITELLPALIAARGAMPRIGKAMTAEIESERGRGFSYDYADLATVLEAIAPVLCANGLALVQPFHVIEGQAIVESVLFHASGQWLAAEPVAMPIGGGGPRAIGAAVTYGRRYALLALLNLAPAGEDDDAAAAERPTRRGTARRSSAPRRTAELPPAERKPTPEDVAEARARLEKAATRGMAMLVCELNTTPQAIHRSIGVATINELRQRAKQADGEISPA